MGKNCISRCFNGDIYLEDNACEKEVSIQSIEDLQPNMIGFVMTKKPEVPVKDDKREQLVSVTVGAAYEDRLLKFVLNKVGKSSR